MVVIAEYGTVVGFRSHHLSHTHAVTDIVEYVFRCVGEQ